MSTFSRRTEAALITKKIQNVVRKQSSSTPTAASVTSAATSWSGTSFRPPTLTLFSRRTTTCKSWIGEPQKTTCPRNASSARSASSRASPITTACGASTWVGDFAFLLGIIDNSLNTTTLLRHYLLRTQLVVEQLLMWRNVKQNLFLCYSVIVDYCLKISILKLRVCFSFVLCTLHATCKCMSESVRRRRLLYWALQRLNSSLNLMSNWEAL